jgi:hypothetical protein
LLQLNPHAVPLHVAIEFAGAVQAVHKVPQVIGLVFDTQAAPHRW